MGAELPFWPRMLRREKAAAYVDLSIAAFERAMSKGELPHPIKLSGQERWSRSALDEALERLSGEGLPQAKKASKFYAQG